MDLRDLFPGGPEPPEFKGTLLGGAFWLAYLVFLPGLLNMFGVAFAASFVGILCANFLYLGLSALCLFFVFRTYLSESLDNFRWELKNNLKISSVGLAVMVVLMTPLALFLMKAPAPVADAWNQIQFWEGAFYAPIVCILLNVVFAPVVIGLLYHVTVFGSLCDNRPWLAYVAVAAVSLLPWLLPAYNGFLEHSMWIHWLYALPVHLVSCWVYQKTGTVVSAMLSHGAFNLLCTLILVIAGY